MRGKEDTYDKDAVPHLSIQQLTALPLCPSISNSWRNYRKLSWLKGLSEAQGSLRSEGAKRRTQTMFDDIIN